MIHRHNESASILNTADCFIILLITFAGIFTRFWMNGWPDFVTFDEVHFGGFTNGYIKQEYFFDIHPPLAKLIIALVSYIGNYKGDIDFDSLYAQKYYDENSDEILADYVTLRLAPQLFSSFVPVLIYITMRILHFSILSSFTSSSLLLFETSIICEGKFILTDGILHFFVSLHLLSLFYACQYPSLPSLIADGITLGFACSCKSTSWFLPFLNAIAHIYFVIIKYQQAIKNASKIFLNEYLKNNEQKIESKNDSNSKTPNSKNNHTTHSKLNLLYFWANIIYDIITRGFLLLILMLFIFYLSFVIHILILRYDGPGSDFLEKSVKNTLLHSKSSTEDNTTFSVEPLTKRNSGPSIFYRFVSLNSEMQKSNMRIDSFHPYQSRPLNWPLLTSSYVAFVVIDDDREVNCLGNLFVYYSSFFSIIFLVVYFVILFIQFLIGMLSKKSNQIKISSFSNWRLIFIVFGYAISYLPFFLVPRCMFLYHYQIPLIFACMAVGAVIDLVFFVPAKLNTKNIETPGTSEISLSCMNKSEKSMIKNSFKLTRHINFLNAFGIIFSILLILLALTGFLIWYPFVYGSRITHDILPLKLYRKFAKIRNDPYQTSPLASYQEAFIPDNWIWGDSYQREMSRINEDSE